MLVPVEAKDRDETPVELGGLVMEEVIRCDCKDRVVGRFVS